MALQIGDNAPDFTLVATDRSEFRLSDNRQKNTVILFFPFAFTGVCTNELCEIRDSYKDYDQLDAQVIAISVDAHPTLAKFKEEQNYNFTLLSDFNKQASTAYQAIYDVFGPGYKGVAKRSAFVVDKNGQIRYAEVLENAGELPDFEAIKECLRQI
jgi:peroxiredoxin